MKLGAQNLVEHLKSLYGPRLAVLKTEAGKLVDYINSLDDFRIKRKGPLSEGSANEHIGAIIVDATLSAGHNYDSQVKPRVIRVKNEYLKGATTSGFLHLIQSVGLEDLLDGWERESTKKLRQIQVVRIHAFFFPNVSFSNNTYHYYKT